MNCLEELIPRDLPGEGGCRANSTLPARRQSPGSREVSFFAHDIQESRALLLTDRPPLLRVRALRAGEHGAPFRRQDPARVHEAEVGTTPKRCLRVPQARAALPRGIERPIRLR